MPCAASALPSSTRPVLVGDGDQRPFDAGEIGGGRGDVVGAADMAGLLARAPMATIVEMAVVLDPMSRHLELGGSCGHRASRTLRTESKVRRVSQSSHGKGHDGDGGRADAGEPSELHRLQPNEGRRNVDTMTALAGFRRTTRRVGLPRQARPMRSSATTNAVISTDRSIDSVGHRRADRGGAPPPTRWRPLLEQDEQRFVSAVSVLEAAIVLESRRPTTARPALDRLLEAFSIEVVAFDADQLTLAREGFRRFGQWPAIEGAAQFRRLLRLRLSKGVE